jgi:hypothetical protein
MKCFPIVDRELRLQSRKARTFWIRFLVVLVAAMAGLGILSPSFHGVLKPNETGQMLFVLLGGMAFLYALVAGVFAAADSISEEKREELHGADVVLGKLAARGLNTLYALLAILPLLALTLLLGGVSAGEFWRATLVLLNTLFLSLAVSVWVSVRSWNGRLAFAGALALMAGLTLAPWLGMDPAQPMTASLGSGWLLASPLYCALLVSDTLHAVQPQRFGLGLGVQQALAWLALTWACVTVRRSWLDSARGGRDAPPLDANQRARIGARRRGWLELNPVLWLAYRDRLSWSNLPLLALLGLCGLLAIGMGATTTTTVHIVLPLSIMWTAHVFVKLWLVVEASRRLHEFRQTNLLELLLLTPLPQGDVLQGVVGSIRHRFAAPVLLMLATDLLVVLAGCYTQGAEWAIAIGLMGAIFAADAFTLTWVGLWQGLEAPTLTRAAVGCILAVLLAPWAVFLLLAGGMGLVWSDRLPPHELLVGLWFLGAYLLDGLLCTIAILRLSSHFRELAARQQPVGRLTRIYRWLRWWSASGESSK